MQKRKNFITINISLNCRVSSSLRKFDASSSITEVNLVESENVAANMRSNLRWNGETQRSVNRPLRQAMWLEEFLCQDLTWRSIEILHASWWDGINAMNPPVSDVRDKYIQRRTGMECLGETLLGPSLSSLCRVRVCRQFAMYSSLQSARFSRTAAQNCPNETLV